MAAREPMAFAKLATRRDVIQPFYITDEHVKAVDEMGNPTDIQVVLGRSSPQRFPERTPPPPLRDRHARARRCACSPS